MRTEKEMTALLTETAQDDDRIRAAYLNGSRANPNAPKDPLQDYDIVYVVRETASFRRNPEWLDRFGERILLHEPDKNDAVRGVPTDFSQTYGYLFLCRDGNRIDLRLQTPAYTETHFSTEKYNRILLDKDGILPQEPSTGAACGYRPPTEAEFRTCCNEFWWNVQNVGKGLWRNEIPYANAVMEQVIRPELNRMLAWMLEKNPGKLGKYLERYLPAPLWKLYRETYPGKGWDNLFTACRLFRTAATATAERFGYAYPEQDDRRMTGYLHRLENDTLFF